MPGAVFKESHRKAMYIFLPAINVMGLQMNEFWYGKVKFIQFIIEINGFIHGSEHKSFISRISNSEEAPRSELHSSIFSYTACTLQDLIYHSFSEIKTDPPAPAETSNLLLK